MTPPFVVIFAYNNENSLTTATIVTYTLAYARDTEIVNSIYHTLVDYVTVRDQVSTGRKLQFKIGKDILTTASGRAFFKAFFKAPYKWAVYGSFKDITNVSYYNLCMCEPPVDFLSLSGSSGSNEIDVSMAQDQTGYILISSGVTLTDGSSEGGESGGGGGVIVAYGTATLNSSGVATVTNANTTTVEKIFLSRQAGRSNMAIYVSAVTPGVSFTITSDAGAIDEGLTIGWIMLA